VTDDLPGGDPPCWAHLLDDEAGEPPAGPGAVVADLAGVDTSGAGGAVWSLPHGGDLDANLVSLPAGGTIAEHVNDVVDVFVYVRSGHGGLMLDGRRHALRPDVAVLVPRGARRAVAAGPDGLAYLSVHRRRPALAVTPRAVGRS
jgi:quercetin dioxygenase-like cupin family protein